MMFNPFGAAPNQADINEQNLKPETLNRLSLEARQYYYEFEAKFLELIEFFVSKGANIHATV